jgi:hypothetical protein
VVPLSRRYAARTIVISGTALTVRALGSTAIPWAMTTLAAAGLAVVAAIARAGQARPGGTTIDRIEASGQLGRAGRGDDN